jgi:hypothetical protein
VDRYAQYINDTHVMSGKKLPDHVDWRLKGAVTMVKDQGVCWGLLDAWGLLAALQARPFL